MAVTPNLTLISNCDADDWDGGVGAVDIDSFIQGTGCLSITYVGNGLRAESTETITAANFETLGYPVIYGWLTFARLAMLETYANGGLRFIVKSSATAWSAWKVAGSDTAPTAGWNCYSVRTNETPDYTGTTAADLTNITQVGWLVNLAIKGIVKWDAFRYGTGLTITGGAEATPETFDSIWAAENDVANKYGIVTKYQGTYFVQGKLIFGDASGTASTYFKDTSESIAFMDVRVGSGFYEIKVQGNATGTTQVFFGTKSGTAGISGCSFKSAGTPKYTLTATDTNITNLGLYGCTFFDASTVSLPAYSANKEVLNSTFELCAEVLADTCIMTNCNFISSSGRAVRISSASHNVTSCNFINCQTAINHNIGGATGSHLHYDYTTLMFTGGTYHIENSAVTPDFYIDIDRLNGSNPDVAKINNSGGGTTTLLTISKTLTITVKDENNVVVVGAQVYIQKQKTETGEYGHPTNPYTSHASNNSQGGATFEIIQDIESDNPLSGWLNAKETASQTEQIYRYGSKSGKIFTLRPAVAGTDNGTGNSTTINETGIGAKDIVEGDTIRMTAAPNEWAIVLSKTTNSVTTTPTSGGTSWASKAYGVHTLALTYGTGDTACVPLMNKETDGSGIATESYYLDTNMNVDIRVRLSTGATKYFPYKTTALISGDLSITAVLIQDTIIG